MALYKCRRASWIYTWSSVILIYINYIVHEINSNIRLFADDTSLYLIEFPDSAAQILNIDLERIGNWASKWLVTYNPDKTEAMLLSRKINKVVHPTLFLNKVPIQEVISHKHLGLFFSQRCDWHIHIEYVTEKAWARINLLRSYKFIIDRKSLPKLYFTFYTFYY